MSRVPSGRASNAAFVGAEFLNLAKKEMDE